MRRLVLAMTGPEDEREFRVGLSFWQRAHQAVAGRCHRASHARKPISQRAQSSAMTRMVLEEAAWEVPCRPLTDAEWERVRPLLPLQKPRVGRPRRDQRVVLDAIVWVLGTGSSWRDVPRERFGAWETVYGRYSEWRKDGRWQRVLEALRFGGSSTTAAKVPL